MAGDPPNHQHPLPSATAANPAERQVHLEAKVEDAETRAARQELKHTVISDKTDAPTGASCHQPQEPHREDEEMRLSSGATGDVPPPRAKTPDDASAPTASEKKVSSPKKKRAHDEVDQNKDDDGHLTSSGAESEGWVVVDSGDKDAEHRSEPQKKRARDETSPPADIHNKAPAPVEPSTTDTSKKDGPPPQTSTSTAAFAASGFSKLASASASPFASAGTGKSVFGGGATGSASSFASLGSSSPSKSVTPPSIPKPTLSFGSKDASAPSPFATVNGTAPSAFGGGGFGGGGFGSSSGGFGGGNFGGGSAFGSALSGSRTGNFASPGIPPIIKSDKPAKPFGAPESDVEEESDEGSDNDGDEGRGSAVEGEKEEKDDVASRDASTPAGGDEEKKAKYKKVVVDDGEAGEATIVQVRARMYYLDKSTNADGKEEIAWRERGAGMLKINVPVDSVNLDSESGGADPKSFDPSVLGESTPENPKLVRLLMRQDSTLRVILNTAMTKNMRFELNDGLKAKSVLFTALEGEEARHVQVQMKMSVQSADVFLKAVEGVQDKMKAQGS